MPKGKRNAGGSRMKKKLPGLVLLADSEELLVTRFIVCVMKELGWNSKETAAWNCTCFPL